MTDRALTLRGAGAVPAEQVNELAGRLLNNKALFPDEMSPVQAKQLAAIAWAYGLDAFASPPELTLYEGKPLVTLDGRIRVCADHPEFDGIEYTRWATREERRAFRVTDDEDMWVACAWRKGVRFPSIGYGRAGGAYERNALVTGSKRTGYNPGRGPELARKRAIVNSLRLLFPLPRPQIPGLEDLLPHVELAGPDEPAGPILEGDAREVPPPVTEGQTRAIHAAARAAGYTTAGYRRRLGEMFGTTTSQELNQAQAQAAIAAFAAEAAAHEQADELTAGVQEARVGATNRGERVRDRLTLPDDAAGVPPPLSSPPPAPDIAEDAQRMFGGELRYPDDRPPTQKALDAYSSALTRANQLGIDLAPYAFDASQITADELDALDANLRATIAANEPPERLAGM